MALASVAQKKKEQYVKLWTRVSVQILPETHSVTVLAHTNWQVSSGCTHSGTTYTTIHQIHTVPPFRRQPLLQSVLPSWSLAAPWSASLACSEQEMAYCSEIMWNIMFPCTFGRHSALTASSLWATVGAKYMSTCQTETSISGAVMLVYSRERRGESPED